MFKFIPDLDKLPEELLDYIAYSENIEGYNNALTKEQKAAFIKNYYSNRNLNGTPFAIKSALKSLGIESKIIEWYKYGGDPYHFKIDLYLTDREITLELFNNLKKLVNQYKNVRSWIDEFILTYLNKYSIYALSIDIGESYSDSNFNNLIDFTLKRKAFSKSSNLGEIYSYTKINNKITFYSKGIIKNIGATLGHIESVAIFNGGN